MNPKISVSLTLVGLLLAGCLSSSHPQDPGRQSTATTATQSLSCKADCVPKNEIVCNDCSKTLDPMDEHDLRQGPVSNGCAGYFCTSGDSQNQLAVSGASPHQQISYMFYSGSWVTWLAIAGDVPASYDYTSYAYDVSH